MNRTDRLLGLLLELQARGRVRAEDLAARFEVSVRTIYRDLDGLAQTGVPLVGTPGKGYELMPGYFVPPLTFTADEAALLALGGEMVRDRVDPDLRRAAEEALRKLDGVLPADRREAVARWRRELFFVRSQSGDDPRLPELRRAIRERRVVRLEYRAYRRPAAERREVEPISLVHMGASWHVAAWCRVRLAPRLFRLDRIDDLRVAAETFVPGPQHANVPPPEPEQVVPEARGALRGGGPALGARAADLLPRARGGGRARDRVRLRVAGRGGAGELAARLGRAGGGAVAALAARPHRARSDETRRAVRVC